MSMTDYAYENPATGEIELNVEGDEVYLNAEEMEEVIAPGMSLNHNETLVDDDVELNVEELEETIAPTPSIPIPPPLR